MFSGVSAQFLAVLETLTESWRRPLNQAPPSTVPDLDQETVLDIYQVHQYMGYEQQERNSPRSPTWSILLRLLKMRGLAVYCYIVYWHYENCCYFIQELFCVGTDLSQKVLTRLEEGSTNTEEVGLMVAASKGTPSRP